MDRSTKLFTCCCCGTRAALVQNGGRHERVCVACGAPLHKLKSLLLLLPLPQPLPLPLHRDRRSTAPPSVGTGRKPDHSARKPPHPRKAPKRRKTRTRRYLEEAFDLIEDVLDRCVPARPGASAGEVHICLTFPWNKDRRAYLTL